MKGVVSLVLAALSDDLSFHLLQLLGCTVCYAKSRYFRPSFADGAAAAAGEGVAASATAELLKNTS